MPRIACVDFPALPLQLLLRDHPDWTEHPAAVVDRDKAQGTLLWVNERARRQNILPGMRYASALSLDRELRAGVVEEKLIDRATEELMEKLRRFTADVEPAEERGVFWLNADGLSLLHPSLLRWVRLLHRDLSESGWTLSAVVGHSRFGSYALAKALPGRAEAVEDPKTEEELARRVPLARLGLPPELRDRLFQLGIDTLGSFMDLPEDGVRRRFGVEVHRLHQLARGELWAPLQPAAATEPVRSEVLLDHPERNLERLLYRLEDMLHELMDRLRSRYQLLAELKLELYLDDSSERFAELRPAQPTLDLTPVLELLRLRLEALPRRELRAGIGRLALTLTGIDPPRDQLELFSDTPGRDLAAAHRALARLRAAFGDDAVVSAKLHDGHLPEAGFRWERMSSLPPAKPRNVSEPHRPLVRRLLTRAKALSHQRRNEPDGWMILGLEGGAVEELRGPFLLSGGWWVRETSREYYYVRTPKTGWLWVYFDRRRRQWFWQGVVE